MKTRVLAVPGTWDTKAPIVLLGHSQGAGELGDHVNSKNLLFLGHNGHSTNRIRK